MCADTIRKDSIDKDAEGVVPRFDIIEASKAEVHKGESQCQSMNTNADPVIRIFKVSL